MRQNETSHKELSLQWLKERDDLRQLIADSKSKADQSNTLLATREIKFKELVNAYCCFIIGSFPFPFPSQDQ